MDEEEKRVCQSCGLGTNKCVHKVSKRLATIDFCLLTGKFQSNSDSSACDDCAKGSYANAR